MGYGPIGFQQIGEGALDLIINQKLKKKKAIPWGKKNLKKKKILYTKHIFFSSFSKKANV